MAWKTLKLGDILIESKIEAITPDTNNRIRVKLNLGGIEQRPDSPDTQGATKYFVRKAGQFIYGKQNLHKGAFGIVPEHLNGYESSSDIPAFDVKPICYPEWIFFYFKQNNLYLKLEFLAKGIGSKRIQTADLLKLSIPVPEKEEQRKLIDGIKDFDRNFEEIKNEFENQIDLLDKARIASITDSVQGNLTANYRLENLEIQTGKNLLNNLNQQKKKFQKETGSKAEVKPQVIATNEIPFAIPKEWVWCRYSQMNEVGTSVSYGVLIPDNHTPNGVPLIRVGDLDGAQNGILPQKFVRKEISDRYKKTILRGGEILIVVVGSNIGKIAVAHENWKGANIARAVSRTVVNGLVNKDYVEYVVRSKYIQDYFIKSSRSIGQPTLNINVIAKALIPLPGIEEQEQIVSELREVLDYYNSFQDQIKSQIENLILLANAYLSSVFQNFKMDFRSFEVSKNLSDTQQNTDTLNYELNLIEDDNKNMELVEVLQEHGKLSAVKLWKLSRHESSIDDFYEELKKQVEVEKTIRESHEKGFLELVV